jgi:hypothetical protein
MHLEPNSFPLKKISAVGQSANIGPSQTREGPGARWGVVLNSQPNCPKLGDAPGSRHPYSPMIQQPALESKEG